MNISFNPEKIKSICINNNIAYLGLFGSYATGEETPDSDIDLLVDFIDTPTLLEKGRVIVELQEFFKKEVDLVSRKNVKPSLKPFIEEQLITLYEEE